MEVQSLSFSDSHYPLWLKEIFAAPETLYYMGNVEAFARPCIGIVGTRRCTPYGAAQAHHLAEGLSQQGFCVVSGLAFGIDAAAHAGAMNGSGGTIAVVAQALPDIMPKHHWPLVKRILDSGGLVCSERNPAKPGFTQKHDYLIRNRLISGLSQGIVVVEAPYKSGARNTANHAVDQNREVMAIPGRVTDEQSQGCLDLLQKGAHLVRSAQDVLRILGHEWKTGSEKKKAQLEEIHLKILAELSLDSKSAAQLGENFSGELAQMYQALTELEWWGWIREVNLKYVRLIP